MKKRLLWFLICPRCQKADLDLMTHHIEDEEIIQGGLTCRHCQRTYPIERGVPRFVKCDKYVKNFSEEWLRHQSVQFDKGGDPRSSREFYLKKTPWSPGDMKGCLVLDAGCGSGRYMDVALKAGAEVVGVDLSFSVDACYQNLKKYPKAHIVQADLTALPFRSDVFDKVYSIGVIHHTPKPYEVFQKLAGLIEIHGSIAIWVYEFSVIIWLKDCVFRRSLRRLSFNLLRRIAKISHGVYWFSQIPVLGKLARCVSPPFSTNHDPEWRELDTFDWLTPRYQHLLTRKEVRRWFAKDKFKDVAVKDPGISASGQKCKTPH